MKVTLFLKLRTTKKKVCAGKATAADFTAAANKYIDHAVTKNGKTKAAAQAVVTAVRNAGCPVSGTKSKARRKR